MIIMITWTTHGSENFKNHRLDVLEAKKFFDNRRFQKENLTPLALVTNYHFSKEHCIVAQTITLTFSGWLNALEDGNRDG